MTPDELKQYLGAMRDAAVMSAKLVLPGGVELAVTFGIPFEPAAEVPPGGWKGPGPAEGVSDPDDPDPLGLGSLDAPLAFDEPTGAELPE